MLSTNGHYALSRDSLRAHAPSIFATQPYHKTSDKYAFVSTAEILDRLEGEGFLPVFVNESRTRIDARRGYLKHNLRLRHRDSIGSQARAIGDVFPEVLLTNSHDGSSIYTMEGGLFRLWCANGMAAPIEGYQTIKLRHSGNLADNVIDGCIRVLEGATKFAHEAQEWRQIPLDRNEQLRMADVALQFRWEKDAETGNSSAPILPSRLLTARRPQDTGDNLWAVTNRIQENLTKGGLRGIGSTGRRTTTRAVTTVDADLKLNRQIMTFAAEFAKLKAAA